MTVETKETPVNLLDDEALKQQDNLTADQEDALQAQILKELENAETPEDKSKDSVAPVIEEDEPEDKPEDSVAPPAPEKDTKEEPKPEGEKPVDELINAAVFCEKDNMVGVSSRIMAGVVIKGGTGLPGLILDTELLENSEYIDDLDIVMTDTNDRVTSNSIIEDTINRKIDNIFIPS